MLDQIYTINLPITEIPFTATNYELQSLGHENLVRLHNRTTSLLNQLNRQRDLSRAERKSIQKSIDQLAILATTTDSESPALIPQLRTLSDFSSETGFRFFIQPGDTRFEPHEHGHFTRGLIHFQDDNTATAHLTWPRGKKLAEPCTSPNLLPEHDYRHLCRDADFAIFWVRLVSALSVSWPGKYPLAHFLRFALDEAVAQERIQSAG